MDITTKSLGMLIDELCTTSQKIWHLQDVEADENSSDAEVAEAFRKIQTLNVRRNLLINAIDSKVDGGVFSTTEKTYK